MKLKSLLIAFIALLGLRSGFSQTADDILGTWLTGSKKGHVEIYKQGGKYFGKIVWLKEPNNEKGEPKKDINNDDDDLKKRPLLGLVNLKDFEFDSDEKEWNEGTIYDPENGNTYSCYITFKDKNTILVRGYIGFSLIGRTDTWVRVESK